MRDTGLLAVSSVLLLGGMILKVQCRSAQRSV